MKGDTKVIQCLNKVLANELAGINQYFLHARMYKNWGFSKLDSQEYNVSIDAMKFADDLIERVLFMEGLPNLQDLGKIYIGEDVAEMIKMDKFLEEEKVIPTLKEAIAYCEESRDYISRELLDKLLAEKEEHIDWLETQQDLITSIGIENYQQSMM